MLSSLKKIFSPSPFRQQAHGAYLALVTQSRKPFFYKEAGVPDSIDGRFDVMALHLFLVIHRLRGETLSDADEFIRVLSEVFFADMDRSLREMGVGDTGVSSRIKKMAGAFYGRLQAYEESFDNAEAFAESLGRNLYRGEAADAETLERMADYVRRNAGHLKTQATEQLLSGRVDFLDLIA